MQNNQNNNSDKSQYVDNATFVNQVLQENPNVNKKALQIAISKLKNELFNGKAEKDFSQQEKQQFSEERQKLADKYKQQATISLERNGQYVSNADFIKEFCEKNKIMNKKNLTNAISRLKCKLFNDKNEALFTQADIKKWQKSRLEKANALLYMLSAQQNVDNIYQENPNIMSAQQNVDNIYQENPNIMSAQQNVDNIYQENPNIMSVQQNVDNIYQENPNINNSHVLKFKRKRNKKEKSSGQPTNEEGIKEIISEYNPKPLKYTSKKGKGTTMSRSDAIELFLKEHTLQEGKQQTTRQINNNINLEEENNDINLEEKNNDLMQVSCKNMNTDNYEVEKKCYNDVEDLEEKSDDFYQVIKRNMETDTYEVEKKCYNDVEDLEEKSDDFSQVVKRNMEKMNGSEMSENNFKYINNNSSSTKKLSNNIENNLK
ncbi:MAG: hypothetical protein IJT15_04505 [Rickettsiales bacterium]|nr:hypothetical protein [Rickettsiales bacterium]